ncbi:uncharacterized protein [Drosophila suzukii]|uniref:Uncharacterized protein isoform X1 n=1 Tax=Drosophila suzukii TaxID=28584 RepID=A0AB40D3Z8_DROSZ
MGSTPPRPTSSAGAALVSIKWSPICRPTSAKGTCCSSNSSSSNTPTCSSWPVTISICSSSTRDVEPTNWAKGALEPRWASDCSGVCPSSSSTATAAMGKCTAAGTAPTNWAVTRATRTPDRRTSSH